MATIRQKKVAKLVIENTLADKPLTGGQILERTGYAPGVVKNPSDVLDSKGVQQELIKHGFNPDAAKEIVTEILYAGENDTVKLKAADMVFKVHGTYAAEKHINLNMNVEPTDRIKELAKKLNI